MTRDKSEISQIPKLNNERYFLGKCVKFIGYTEVTKGTHKTRRYSENVKLVIVISLLFLIGEKNIGKMYTNNDISSQYLGEINFRRTFVWVLKLNQDYLPFTRPVKGTTRYNELER